MVDPSAMLREIDFLLDRIIKLNDTNSELQSTITAQEDMIRRLKQDAIYWYEKYFLIPGAHENITIVIDAVATRHLVLMNELGEK